MSNTSIASAQKSEHFNGKRFVNPTLQTQFKPTFYNFIKMMSHKRAKWPKHVENKGTPQLNHPLTNNDFAITFINHATFLIQTEQINILTDPVWSKRASPVSWAGPKRVRKPGVDLDNLPKIDLILISHNHYDHLDKKTLKKIATKHSPIILVPIGEKKRLKSWGIKHITELNWWDQQTISPIVQITFTPSQHASARSIFNRDKTLWGSYFIKIQNRTIYYGADSGYSPHFSEISKRLSPPDVAILSIGAYLPQFFMQPIHTSPAEAVLAHKDLRAKQSIAMHYGTFQMSAEAMDQPIIDLQKARKNEGITPQEFITLHEGETKLYKTTTK